MGETRLNFLSAFLLLFSDALETHFNSKKQDAEECLFPHPILHEPQLVEHKVTHQEFELIALSQVDMREPEQREMFWKHIETVKKLASLKHLTRLLDLYQEEKAI